jgi:hypothetical protein
MELFITFFDYSDTSSSQTDWTADDFLLGIIIIVPQAANILPNTPKAPTYCSSSCPTQRPEKAMDLALVHRLPSVTKPIRHPK